MEVLQTVMPVVNSILVGVLLTVLIIIGLKIVGILNKVQDVLDNVEDKINSLNGIFSVIENINARFGSIADKTYGFIENLITKLIHRKSSKDDDEEFEDEEIEVQSKKRRKKRHGKEK